MTVAIYTATPKGDSIAENNVAVQDVFNQAGFGVTCDISAGKITVNNDGNIFGLSTFKSQNLTPYASGFVLLVDVEQKTLILTRDVQAGNTNLNYNNTCAQALYPSIIVNGVDAWGDWPPRDTTSSGDAMMSWADIANLTVSRTTGQPAIPVPLVCASQPTKVLTPVFISATAMAYPVGTKLTDGSTSFIADGNFLMIRNKQD